MRETSGSPSRSVSSATSPRWSSALCRIPLSGDGLESSGITAVLPSVALFSADLEELDLEHERRVRGNRAREPARSVAELGRDRELALAADLHAYDALVP